MTNQSEVEVTNKVVARFYVSQITKTAYNGPQGGQVTLQAVSRGPENKEWAQATPSGQVTMTVKNGAAYDFFESMLGKDIVITFEARPIICAQCKEEEAGSQYADNGLYLSNGDYVHHRCRDQVAD